jgi:hypothetical protein
MIKKMINAIFTVRKNLEAICDSPGFAVRFTKQIEGMNSYDPMYRLIRNNRTGHFSAVGGPSAGG